MEKNNLEAELIFLKPNEGKTSELAAAAVGCPLSQIAKNIVLKGSHTYVLVLSGDRKVDLKKFSAVVGEQVRLATPDEVLRETGYPVGGVPPFGHITKLKVFVDASIKRHDVVYTSGGADNVLMKIDVDALLKIVGDNIVDVSSAKQVR